MDATEYKRIASAVLAGAESRQGMWRWLREHIYPEAIAAAEQSADPISASRRLCFVAADGLLTLAGAFELFITPRTQRWFALASAQKNIRSKNAAYDDWFAQATDIMHADLARSNFHTKLHQVFLDACGLGTGCLFIDMPDGDKLNFVYVPTGTYGVEQDECGRPDTLARVFKLTPHQAAKRWGLESLPENVRAAFEDSAKRYTQQDEYLHLVMPNPDAVYGTSSPLWKSTPETRKYLSVYMSWGGGHESVLERGGYDEFPYFVMRFLPDGTSAYGHAPGQKVMHIIRRAQKLNDVMDTLGEVAAFPRVLMLAEQVGEVDLRAGGKTIIKRTDAGANLPREWATAGRYDVGQDRIDRCEKKIEQAFFKPMLQVVTPVDRPMTATEVVARQKEQMLAFSPCFTCFTADAQYMLLRIFSLLFAAGKFNAISEEGVPSELIAPNADGGEEYELKLPAVNFNGELAQSIQRAQSSGAEAYLNQALTVVQATGDTAMLDILDLSKYGRQLYDTLGAPAACRRSASEVETRQKQREVAAQQAQAAQVQAAQAAANRDNAAAAAQM